MQGSGRPLVAAFVALTATLVVSLVPGCPGADDTAETGASSGASDTAPASSTTADVDGTGPDSGSTSSSSVPSFEFDVYPIFAMTCGGTTCHIDNSGPAAGALALDPDAATAYANLVGVGSTQTDLMLVSPGDSTMSYLLHKLEDTQADVGGSGTVMPPGLPPLGGMLPAEDIAVVTAWIDGGAPP